MRVALTCIHSVQFSRSAGSHSLHPWAAAFQASLSITNSQSLLMSTESVMPSNHLILCHPLLLLPSIFPSIRVFNESVIRIRWPKYWSFSFSINPSDEYSGLISFKIDWFNLLAVQGTEVSKNAAMLGNFSGYEKHLGIQSCFLYAQTSGFSSSTSGDTGTNLTQDFRSISSSPNSQEIFAVPKSKPVTCHSPR